jgi:hypothetical protein
MEPFHNSPSSVPIYDVNCYVTMSVDRNNIQQITDGLKFSIKSVSFIKMLVCYMFRSFTSNHQAFINNKMHLRSLIEFVSQWIHC